MAEKKAVSSQLTSQFTGAATDAAKQKVASLQAQLSGLQAPTAPTEASVQGGTQYANQVSQYEQQKRDLQSQLGAQQAIIADPTSQMSARQKDLVSGAQFGEAVLGDGLGRLGQDQGIQSMLAQQAELAQGFSSQEMLARREKAKEGLAGQAQSQSRALMARLGAAGS